MKTNRIEPRILKGFRDYLPAIQIPRERIMGTARDVFRSYGFVPIDTPALEYEEVLVGKGGQESDKQMYRFEDQGGRKVALRFDLTIPLARFVAQHEHELGIPFKRYHMAPVWRGEKNQAGRYREFVQCDFDTIGTESQVADLETALVIHDLLEAIGVDGFCVRINNRKVLTGLLESLGLGDKATEVLRAIDKLEKVGVDAVTAELEKAGLDTQAAARVLEFAHIAGGTDEILAQLEGLVGENETGQRGIAELADLFRGVRALGISEERMRIDVGIARGLDYYTGTVYETILTDLPKIGSICSGGRYDDLASLYTKTRLPGVGASLGLDRLLTALETLGRLETKASTAEVFIPLFDAARRDDYLALAARLRKAGIAVEVYPDAKKLGAQLKYADRRGHRLALILGENEWQAGTVQIKTLADGSVRDVPLADLESAIAE